MLTLAKRYIKTLLPEGRALRVLPFGPGRGLRMSLDLRTQSLFFLGLYEVELNNHIRRLVRPGDVVYDVGAAHGYDALLFAKLGAARVLTFEGSAEMQSVLLGNLAANPQFAERISVVSGWVGDGTSEGDVVLDAIAHEQPRPSLVKMDIEGAEARALRGFARTLAEAGPGLLLEVHGEDVEADCRRLLSDLGYSDPRVIEPRKWLPETRPLAGNRWLIYTRKAA